MNIINNVKEKRKFNALEISLILSNTFLYFSAGLTILHYIQDGLYQGLFTLLIAVFNFVFVLVLYKKAQVDRNLVFLLIGLVLTFASLAAPIQLEGSYITLFWAIESVLLLWLAQKSGIQLLKLSSVIILVLMMISLLMDWVNIYEQSEPLMIALNKAFITSVVCLIAIALNLRLTRIEPDVFLYKAIYTKHYRIALASAFVILLYFAILLELSFQVNTHIENSHFKDLITGFYSYLFLTVGIILSIRKDSIVLNGLVLGFGVMAILSYLSFYQFEISSHRNDYLEQKSGIGAFLFHYLIIALVIFLSVSVLQLIRRFKESETYQRIYLWFLSFVLIFIASAELTHLILLLQDRSIQGLSEKLSYIGKIGFPILWGVCSFVFMFLGMRKKNKDLRVISLCLFAITLLKLFIFDLRDISEGGKIAAFIILGILLLIISFMYQKLKTILLDDSPKPE